MRLPIGDHHLGFWWAKTYSGFSMGPLISGVEHVHLTFFVEGEVINAHLKIREHGQEYYKNLVTTSPNILQYKIKQAAADLMNSIGYADPNQDAVLLTDRTTKLFRKLLSGSLEMTYKGRTGYIDFDFGMIFEEIKELAENPSEFVAWGRASDLIGADFGLGITEDGVPLFAGNNHVMEWRPVYRQYHSIEELDSMLSGSFDSLQNFFGKPLYEVVSVTGIPQLFSEIERRRLFERWCHRNRADLISWLSTHLDFSLEKCRK